MSLEKTDNLTYLEAYNFAKIELCDCGIPNADIDARLILEKVCGTSFGAMYANPYRVLSTSEAAEYKKLVFKRKKRIPLQYIFGEADFMGLSFKCDKRALIPRQDTECLVEEALRRLHDGMRILDLCTGSGCIVLSLLKYSNDTSAAATDISSDALSLARENTERLGLYGRIDFYNCDLFPEDEKSGFDIIVANPPYIPPHVIDTLEAEVKEHEPYTALYGGEDGLVFYRRITKDAKSYMTRGGFLLVEIAYDQSDEVKELFEEAGFKDVECVKDLGQNDRVVIGTCY